MNIPFFSFSFYNIDSVNPSILGRDLERMPSLSVMSSLPVLRRKAEQEKQAGKLPELFSLGYLINKGIFI